MSLRKVLRVVGVASHIEERGAPEEDDIAQSSRRGSEPYWPARTQTRRAECRWTVPAQALELNLAGISVKATLAPSPAASTMAWLTRTSWGARTRRCGTQGSPSARSSRHPGRRPAQRGGRVRGREPGIGHPFGHVQRRPDPEPGLREVDTSPVGQPLHGPAAMLQVRPMHEPREPIGQFGSGLVARSCVSRV